MVLYRLLFSSFLSLRRQSASTFFSVLVIGGIATGAAALIIALSVLNGFNTTMEKMLISNSAHLTISGFDYQEIPVHPEVNRIIRENCGTRLNRISPFISRPAITKFKENREGIILKATGLQEITERTGFRLIAGRVPAADTLEIMPGAPLARKLNVKPGDYITVFLMKNAGLPSEQNFPEILKLRVSGIYESGISKFDETTVYSSLDAFTRFSGISDRVTGYEIILHNTDGVSELTGILQSALGYPFYVKNFQQEYKHIFTWLELQQQPAPIALGLIMIVAVFNIFSALIIVVLERRKSIGVYTSLGIRRSQVTVAFLLQGVLLGALGSVAGMSLAGVLMYLQVTFNIITLPGGVYFLSRVPIVPTVSIFVQVGSITLLLSLCAALLPALSAGKQSPVEMLRYD